MKSIAICDPIDRDKNMINQVIPTVKHTLIIVATTLIITGFIGSTFAAHGPDEEDLQRTAAEIYELIMCPLCAGQTIAQSSNETSSQMRDLVLKKLRQGETKEEILQYFESRYGERILATPNKRGFNLALWFLPFVFVALAAIVIYFVIRRWSERMPETAKDALDENHFTEYSERLEKELKQFDQRL